MYELMELYICEKGLSVKWKSFCHVGFSIESICRSLYFILVSSAHVFWSCDVLHSDVDY